MDKHRIFIGVCYHRPAPLLESRHLNPIQVGRAGALDIIPGMIGDNTGDNISVKNPQYNELTALYWMWKNVDAEYLGLMHYRRFLNFSPRKNPRNGSFSSLDDKTIKKFGLYDEAIEKACFSADILTPPLIDTHPSGAPHMVMSNRRMYHREHFGNDINLLETIVAENSPSIAPFLTKILESKQAIFGNIAIMRQPLFDDYCSWLFDILAKVDKQIDTSRYNKYQQRMIGFLAERLTHAYVTYAVDQKNVRWRRLPQINGIAPPPRNDLTRLHNSILNRCSRWGGAIKKSAKIDETIHIVLAFDGAYAPHAAVTMFSALNALGPDALLHFHALDSGGVAQDTCDKMNRMVQNLGGKLSFHKINDEALGWLEKNHNDYSISTYSNLPMVTYFRLLIPEILPVAIDKVIYIDPDTIVAEDLINLWNFDLDGAAIAAAADEGGLQQTRKLQLPISHTYFNAGIMILDLHRLRAMDLRSKITTAYKENGPYVTLQDQDLLNIVFANRVARLPLRWNANTRLYVPNVLDASYSVDEAKEAAIDPGILHFSDRRKPWHLNCNHPLSELYWDLRNQTPWRETATSRRIRRAKGRLRETLNAQQRRDRRTRKQQEQSQ